MAKIEVRRVEATQSIEGEPPHEMEPHYIAIVDYGTFEARVPLPARNLIGDDWGQIKRDYVPAMESLAAALLAFAAEVRKKYPEDF